MSTPYINSPSEITYGCVSCEWSGLKSDGHELCPECSSKLTGYQLASTLWTPAYLLTEAWYDAADLATITEAAGAVSQWDDKSGKS